QRGDPFDVLYFFPDDLSVEYYKKTTTKPELSDFYIEMDRGVFNDNYLFEGYIYEDTMTSGLQVVMLTDILVKGTTVIDLDYPLRHALLVELTMGLGTLNNHTQLTVHPYVICTNDCLLQVFKANFKYKCELVCVEHIMHSKKERCVQPLDTGIHSKWVKRSSVRLLFQKKAQLLHFTIQMQKAMSCGQAFMEVILLNLAANGSVTNE
ncbi:hypothetical protein EBZ39_19260, partial [bacterium]|nr:hypothetical protein [bacterium]